VKSYRQNAHVLSLVAWSLLCAAAAGLLFYHSARIVSRPLHWMEIAGGAALLLLGPAAFVVYLLRANLVWVSVDPEEGIVVSGKRVIPWEEIERVERRRPKLRKKSGPAEAATLKESYSGCGDWGGCGSVDGEGALIVIGIVLVLLAAVVLFWLIAFVLVPLIIIPVLEVFAPLGDRITIVAGRRGLLLRDLRDADAFLDEVRPRVPEIREV
jgi:hypothetical protein